MSHNHIHSFSQFAGEFRAKQTAKMSSIPEILLSIVLSVSLISIVESQDLNLSELNEKLAILEKNFQSRITALEETADELKSNLKKTLEIIQNYDSNTNDQMVKFEEDTEQMKDASLNKTKEILSQRLTEFGTIINETLINFNVSVHRQILEAINEKSNAKLSDIDGKLLMTNILHTLMFVVAIALVTVFILLKYKVIKCKSKNKEMFELVPTESKLVSNSEVV